MSSDPKQPDAPAQDSTQKTAEAPATKVNLAVIAGLGALVFVAIAYGVGRMQMAPKVKGAEQRAASAAQGAASAKQKESAEHAKVLQLEARRRLDLALLALDDRNFGIAQADLKAAAGLIEAGHPPKDSALRKLSTEIEKINITVSQDLASERAQIIDLIKRFDRIVPPLEAHGEPH